jgi:hypothetical protein
MSVTITRSKTDSEELLYQAAVDSEFRTTLSDNPSAFGMPHDNVALPRSVEAQDQASTALWSEGIAAVDIYGCATSCSWGIITAICDGMTK